MPKIFDFATPEVAGVPNDFLPGYPNPPDLRFNYYQLLDLARNADGIATAPNPAPTVGIVGAGVAGMTAARELHRSGYKVRVFEASDRIAGRHYTVPVPGQTTAMELGAMRFPYFPAPGSKNCLFDYYMTSEAQVTTEPFPNPGSAPGNTGVYVNGGLGPDNDFKTPRLILWPASKDSYNPPNDDFLKPVYDLVYNFIKLFTTKMAERYTQENWGRDLEVGGWPIREDVVQ